MCARCMFCRRGEPRGARYCGDLSPGLSLAPRPLSRRVVPRRHRGGERIVVEGKNVTRDRARLPALQQLLVVGGGDQLARVRGRKREGGGRKKYYLDCRLFLASRPCRPACPARSSSRPARRRSPAGSPPARSCTFSRPAARRARAAARRAA